MLLYVLVALIIILILGYYAMNQRDTFYNYDWSQNWSDLDRAARIGADCSPINKIQRKMGDQTVWIWTVPKTCEQGLPHTRAVDVIAIPVDYSLERLPSTLDHERIHLLQRQMPGSWARFYKLSWDYDLYTAPPVGMPSDLIEMRRSNPDTAAEPWCCWRSHWWPVAVYSSRTNLFLKDAQIKWWDSEMGISSTTPPEEWIRFFGTGVHQLEHPHEITAEYLSGPLRRGRLPAQAPEAMVRLRDAWTEDSLFPSTNR